MTQVADPAVSRLKFEREVADLRSIEHTLVARGWWLMSAVFPIVKVAFATVNVKPRVLAVTAAIDFTDYDARPPSVKFVDPFEERELTSAELLTKMPRRASQETPPPTDAAGMVQIPGTELIQTYGPQLTGFLCLPGVREYHEHPAHTGDAWELHRSLGEGKLFHILETIWRYGSAPINGLGFQIAWAFNQTEVPA